MNRTAESPFHLAQITDTHIRAEPAARIGDADSAQSLRQVLTTLLSSHRPIEAVTLTGDLSDDGSPQSYRRLRDLLCVLNLPMDCLVGNHDDPAALAAELIGDRIQGRGAFQLPGWQIVLLNSRCQGQTAGRISATELERLNAVLGASADRAALVFLHHPPVSIGSPWMDALGLREPEAFLEVIRRHPQIRIVAFGHIHQAFDLSRDGVRWLGSPSTCTQFMPQTLKHTYDPRPPGYRWFELYPDGAYRTGVERVS